ncbi:MAG: hypothetical protein U1F43_20475 [Myxococcota bacterium]
MFTLASRAFDDLNWIGRFATRDLEGWPAEQQDAARPIVSDAIEGDRADDAETRPST